MDEKKRARERRKRIGWHTDVDFEGEPSFPWEAGVPGPYVLPASGWFRALGIVG